jgi:transposase-like protein
MSQSTISTYQLFDLFPDEEAARVYLEGRLWPSGPVCPACGTGERISALGTCATRKAGFYRCLGCGFDFTVRTNTVMERSKVPLHKWVYAMYLLVTARKGISSLQLAKEIGVTQKTAWFILGRLRDSRIVTEESVMKTTPPELDKIADVVLNYRPKPKSKSAKKRARKAAKKAKS